jgi:phosphoglycerate dehydrogenase-like enzyme
MRAGEDAGVRTIVLAMDPDLVGRFFPADLRAELEALGDVVPVAGDLQAAAAGGALRDAEVIVTGWGTTPIDRDLLDAMPRLCAIVHSAGSVRAVVSKEVYRRGIGVSSQAWANALPVAEYALAMILLAAKGTLRAGRRYRAQRGRIDVLAELADRGTVGRRVGIVGASVVGRRVVELLRPFDLQVVLADPTLTSADALALGVPVLPLDQLLTTSAVVSLHAPLLPSTAGMIGAAELALLPDGATLINTARGALVEEPALIAELRTGRVEAVLDVTDPEVPEPSSPLWDLPNLILTPHVAGSAGTELRRLGASVVAEAARALRGEPLLHPVTEQRYDSLA